MKRLNLRLLGAFLLLFVLRVHATTHYVDLNCTNATSPYTDWSTAATNIQDAIGASVDGDIVLVTNGVYASGGVSMDGVITNRVSIDKAITVQSVNGPWVTIIDGASFTNNASAIRGTWLTNGAALIGFTVQHGATRTITSTALGSGGGVWCYSSNCVVANCVIKANTAYYNGVVFQGNIQNCLISSNIALSSSAVSDATLNNCTIIGNSAYGVSQNLGRLWATNCIIYFNQNGNYSGAVTFNRCCTTPLATGTGNFTNSPQLFADGVHLSSSSPCIGAGTTPARPTDLFGRGWSNSPAIGCAEYDPAPALVVPQIRVADQPLGFAVRCPVQGQTPLFVWWLKDGIQLQDDTHFGSTQTTNLTAASTLISDAGNYQLVASNAVGVVTSAITHLTIHCVDAAGTNATVPYVTWGTAATNIQDAIGAAADTDIILVTNGVYSAGGKSMDGVITNRVSLDKAIAVQSLNGPLVTMIQAGSVTNGNSAVRGAWLTNGAILSGFTVQGGATRIGVSTTSGSGGGVWCSSSNAVVANCIIRSNMAYWVGSGVYQGSIVNCLITSNYNFTSPGGSVCNGILNNCTIVGNLTYGVYQSGGILLATNCIIYANSNNYSGGTYSHCCITPLPTGAGNFTNAPQLFADGVHLSSGSPCIGAGVAANTSADIFGKVWSNAPAIGCAEYDPLPMVTLPQIQLSGDPIGFICQAAAQGDGIVTYWLKDGVLVTNGGEFSFAQSTSLLIAATTPTDAGNYQLVTSNAFGVVTSAVVQISVNSFHFVNPAGLNPTTPYSTWDTAATNIQDAITAAGTGDIIVVTNGIYSTGGKSVDGVITNRVVIDKPILVRSLNGATVTRIQGAWDTGSTANGNGAIRCVWITNNAVLAGFTVSGGATRLGSTPDTAVNGGGIWGTSNNAVVANCTILTNSADNSGAGAYRVKLVSCTITGNFGNGPGTGTGGGAKNCILVNCVLTKNSAKGNGGGVDSCNATNCAFINNRALMFGSGANSGTLANCTLVNNTSGGIGGGGGAAANATVINSIVYSNVYVGSGASNYVSCSFTSSDSDPLPTGNGNIDVDPQLIADLIHLGTNSPCIGAGTNTMVFGIDIDGQTWSNAPSMGCDEWHPEPLVVLQPAFYIEPIARRLTFVAVAAGQPPFTYGWLKDGVVVQDSSVFSNSAATNLTASHFGPGESGNYQIVVSNSAGSVTSRVASVVIHVVDAAGSNPVAPYSTWAMAATNIQDAIDSASVDEIVLVTNGVYASGGKVMAGDLTNRVALNKPLMVLSMNGCSVTTIRGEWDSVSTNGPGAVRCAYVADGALLAGFTLCRGATRSSGDVTTLLSGAGVWCTSTNGIVANCILTNNFARYGGGIAYGTLNNSLATYNVALNGGGAYSATLNNCTVVNNYSTVLYTGNGAGTYNCRVRNSIVMGNLNAWPYGFAEDEYNSFGNSYLYSCTYPPISGTGNISGYSTNIQFVDLFHISANSGCRGAGNALYATGYDLDGEPWANPPSIGCDEVIDANLTGPLSVQLGAYQTNWLVNHLNWLTGIASGRVSRVQWSFGEGATVTNLGVATTHIWTNSGDYAVVFTAYNNDNPSGVSASLMMHVDPLTVPQLQSFGWATNGFRFQFLGQTNANYVVQYATNLASPNWLTLQNIYFSTGQVYSITDTTGTNGARFYRVWAQ